MAFRLCSVLGAAAASLVLATLTVAPAHAQATRTWVSGVGDDANPCSRTAPCKTFAGAISKTAAGGVISVLDPGGFGAVTITKPITLDGTGVSASILNTGIAGVIINTEGDVNLRSISIDGGFSGGICGGITGVRVVKARSVHLDGVYLANQQTAIETPLTTGLPDIYVDVALTDVDIHNNCTAGLNATPSDGHPVRVTLADSNISQSNTAVIAGPGSEVWVAGSQIVLGNTGLLSTGGVIHDMCGNLLIGNATDGSWSDHAPVCTPPAPPGSSGAGSTTTGGSTAPASYCVVPNLKGKKVAVATSLLSSAGCALGKVGKKKAPKAKRKKVLSQTIPAGTEVKPGTVVSIKVGR